MIDKRIIDNFASYSYVVMVNFGKVLLLKRTPLPDGTTWVLPGGIIPHGRLLPDAVFELLHKQTGIQLQSSERILGPKLELSQSGGDFEISLIFKVCTSTNYDIRINDQFKEYVWSEWNELPGLQDETIKQIAWALGR